MNYNGKTHHAELRRSARLFDVACADKATDIVLLGLRRFVIISIIMVNPKP